MARATRQSRQYRPLVHDILCVDLYGSGDNYCCNISEMASEEWITRPRTMTALAAGRQVKAGTVGRPAIIKKSCNKR